MTDRKDMPPRDIIKEKVLKVFGTIVKDDPMVLQYLRAGLQSPELCMTAVRSDWRALIHVYEPTADICKIAIDQSSDAIDMIDKSWTEMVEYHRKAHPVIEQ